MPLHKIKDFDPDYRAHFEDQDVIGYDLYAGADKVGSVEDILVDDAGKIRYLIVNTGVWILGKQVLMPVGQAQIDYKARRIVAGNLTRAQVEALPQYDGKAVEYEQEEQVRGVYRPATTGATAVGAAVDTAAPLDYDRNTYSYDRDPALYNLDESKHQNLRLYEERLIASKTRAKTGEVYEETPDIRKEAFVREEVSVRKEVDHETVNAEETLRREELDIDTEGRPVVDKGTDTRRPNRGV